MNTANLLWHRLAGVTQLQIEAVSQKGDSGWNGSGTGEVEIEHFDTTLMFLEKGTWSTAEGHALTFKNTFRWTYKSEQSIISLEHLRYGVNTPVFLFDLMEKSETELISSNPYLCLDDIYEVRLDLQVFGFNLQWTIKGPKKDELIHYAYR